MRFISNSVVKDFFTTDAMFPKRPPKGDREYVFSPKKIAQAVLKKYPDFKK
jgi:hypothetical protein